MLKLGTVRWRGRCAKHPGFDPQSDGSEGIAGECRRCAELVAIFENHQRTLQLMRAFGPPRGDRRSKTEREANRQQSLFGV